MKIVCRVIPFIFLIISVFPLALSAQTCPAKMVSIINKTDRTFELRGGSGETITIPAGKTIIQSAKLGHFYYKKCSLLKLKHPGKDKPMLGVFDAQTPKPAILIEKNARGQIVVHANSIGGHFKAREMMKYHGVKHYLS